MKRWISLILVLLLTFSGMVWAETDYTLPSGLVGGPEANPSCYTENGYEDESLKVRIEKVFYDNVEVHLAWAEVKSPTQLRTAIMGTEKEPVAEGDAGVIVRANNAVIAINGDMFTRRQGIIYRQGVPLKLTESPQKDALFIDENGDFHIFKGSNPAEMAAYLQTGHQIVNSFAFGPALVINGEVQTIPSDYWFEPEGRCQRTILAQIGPLSYLLVEVLGRTNDSRGFTMQKAAEFMGTLGVQTAYNLDGGDSTVLYFGKTFYDKDFHYIGNGRKTSDIIYVCSAVDPATWKDR